MFLQRPSVSSTRHFPAVSPSSTQPFRPIAGVRKKHMVAWAAPTDTLTRISELKMKRQATLDHLAQLEQGIQDLEQAITPPEKTTSDSMEAEDAVLSDVLDNFGYIRQFSGEPYDFTKAMGVS